ncbi:structural maintenance of chromosomes protein 6 like protein smc-6 [Ditylenchus destructor]|nr:structural maintenance of chromosomes protein 6 like protein smc-6 [Ditylenchus destructor]
MVQGEVRKIGGDIERAKADYQTFNASRRNRLALLGPHVMEVMKLIRDNKRLFKTEPIGPIGGHVKLRDEKWATSVEFCLKGMLNKFICDSMEDRRVLDELCRKRKIRADVITYKCSRPKIDTSSGQPPQKFLTIERAIDISVDVVHNVLVDHLAIEGILLIESDDEARNLMRTNPPPNVHMTQTLSCSVVYPRRSTRSNYRYYANPKFVSRFFDKDAEFSKRDFKAESATLQNSMEQAKRRETELSREKSDAENSLRHIRGKLDAICHEIHATTLDLKAIDERENELLKIMSSSDLIETFKETIAELEKRRQEIVDQLEEAKRTLAVKESEKDETKQAVDEITGQLNQITVALKNANERLRSLEDQEEKCIASIDNERIRLEKCDHLTKKHTEDKKVLSQRRETLEQECYEKVNEDKISYQQPPGMCIPPDYNDIQPTKELDAEIAATERQIKLANESLDSARLITTEQLIHFRETNKTFCRRLEIYTNIYRRLLSLMSKRRIRLNALKWSMPLLLEKAFVENMSHRNFRGTLMVDNAARRIEIKVETHKTATQSQSRSSSQARFSQAPEFIDNQVQSDDDDDDRTQGKANKKKALQDLKGLSGGERSYTTSCFVMALWNCVDSPFCCLDEFDVFMDMINRRFVMEMLVEYAESNKWSQFFFFTPQDISELGRDQDHVQIFNMPKVRET